jgi:hypothetical protein
MLNIKSNNSALPLSTFHVIKELKELIIFLICKKRIKHHNTNYRKMIKEGLRDIKISKKFSPYSLKHAAIDKLVRQGCGITEINKMGKYSMNSTVALTHYNPTSSNVKAVDKLTIKEMENSILKNFNRLSQEENKTRFEEFQRLLIRNLQLSQVIFH